MQKVIEHLLSYYEGCDVDKSIGFGLTKQDLLDAKKEYDFLTKVKDAKVLDCGCEQS